MGPKQMEYRIKNYKLFVNPIMHSVFRLKCRQESHAQMFKRKVFYGTPNALEELLMPLGLKVFEPDIDTDDRQRRSCCDY